MKKVFTLFLSLLFVSVSWAQDSMETALELGETNTWEYDSSVEGSYIYFKYYAEDATVIKLGSYSMSVVEEVDGVETSLKSMTLENYTYGYIARAGHTVYVKASKSESGVSFTAEFLSFTGLGDGETADDPLTIVPGETQVIGPAVYSGYTYSDYYATYTAEKDGVLVLTTLGYCYVYVDGTRLSYTYGDGYVYEIQVTAGTAYSIVFSYYSPICFTSEMTYPAAGELSNPIAIVEGEDANEVPAAAGTYYYIYTPSATGYGTITSDETLTDGNVKVYTSKSSVTSTYSSAYATSADNEFDVRFELSSTSTTYYIEVNKTDATDDVQKFSFTYSDYDQGDTERNPFVITDDSEQTLPYASGTYYYSYTVPAGTHKFLVVTATSEIESSTTYVYIYPEGDYYWNGEYGAAPQQLEVDVEDATTYIIKWISKETSDLTFTVTLKDIEKGDVITDPIEAVLGSNDVASGTKYYTYTPTKACKLTLEGNEDIEMIFPKGTGEYDGEYTAALSGVTYTLNVDADTQYYIETINSGEASTFILSEVDFEAGDSRALPIDVSDNTDYAGSYTLTDANSNGVWLSYTASSDGVLTIACDAPYSRRYTVTYYKNDDTNGSSMISYDYTTYETEYKAEISAATGDVYYVYLSGVSSDYTVTFTMAELGEGQSVDTAIEIFKDVEVNIEEATEALPMWYKVYLAEGTVNIDFDDSVEANWYTSYADAASGNGAELNATFWYNYDEETYEYTYGCSGSYDITADEEGYHYIEITYGYDVNLIVSGDAVVESPADGIGAINATVTTGAVYNLSGMKVGTTTAGLPSGVYVVTANGKTRKVVVK